MSVSVLLYVLARKPISMFSIPVWRHHNVVVSPYNWVFLFTWKWRFIGRILFSILFLSNFDSTSLFPVLYGTYILRWQRKLDTQFIKRALEDFRLIQGCGTRWIFNVIHKASESIGLSFSVIKKNPTRNCLSVKFDFLM